MWNFRYKRSKEEERREEEREGKGGEKKVYIAHFFIGLTGLEEVRLEGPLNMVKSEEISVFSQTSLLPISFLCILVHGVPPLHFRQKGPPFALQVNRVPLCTSDEKERNWKQRNRKQRSL